jgi:hypothetical protein
MPAPNFVRVAVVTPDNERTSQARRERHDPPASAASLLELEQAPIETQVASSAGKNNRDTLRAAFISTAMSMTKQLDLLKVVDGSQVEE